MASINYDFCDDKDFYSDGDIEKELLEIVKSSLNYQDVLAHDRRWPVLYHFSQDRENILSWYDFDKEKTLLEIGAGCGALTGLFCSKVKEVSAIELSRSRAEIVYERHRDVDNLNVICGNFDKIQFSQTFDYITLIGVLEYTRSFFKKGGEESYRLLFSKIKKLLKPGGVLFVAIENKFGLKYFSGRRDDHTGSLFEGITLNPRDKDIETFGKEELTSLFKNNGFQQLHFYYPLPDYKLPGVLYSDHHLPSATSVILESPNFDHPRLDLFDERLAYYNIIKNKKFDFFSNSFLVICSSEEIETKYIRYANYREPQFQIFTKIGEKNGTKLITKLPRSMEAKDYLKDLGKFHDRMKNILTNSERVLVPKLLKQTAEGIDWEYIDGACSIEDKLLDAFFNNNLDKFIKIIDEYYNLINSSIRWIDNFIKTPVMDFMFKGVDVDPLYSEKIFFIDIYIDLTFENILKRNNKYYLIDLEWAFSSCIPSSFVLFRALIIFYQYKFSHFKIGSFYNLHEIFKRYNLSNELIKCYYQMENNFQKWINEDNVEILRKYSRTVQRLFLTDAYNENYFAQIYIDNGLGFNETQTQIKELARSNFHKVVFDISKHSNILTIRFDPINENATLHVGKVYLEDLNGKKTHLDILTSNCIYNNNNALVFLSDDPQIQFDISHITDPKFFVFFYEIIGLGRSNLRNIYKRFEILEEELKNETAVIDELKNEIEVKKDLIEVQDKIIRHGGMLRRTLKRLRNIIYETTENSLSSITNWKFKHSKMDIRSGEITGKNKNRSVCLFCHYGHNQKIAPYVEYYVKSLYDANVDVVFISSCSEIAEEDILRIKKYCRYVIVKGNFGYDFGCWIKGHVFLYEKKLLDYDNFLWVNDSVYGPFYDIKNILNNMENLKLDLCGLVDSYEHKYHIQSYFLMFNKKLYLSDDFSSFTDNFKIFNSRSYVIRNNEIGLSQYLLKKGYKIGALYPVERILGLDNARWSEVNLNHYAWKKLINRYKVPFIKRELIFKNPLNIPIKNWEEVVAKTGYDVSLIKEHFKTM